MSSQSCGNRPSAYRRIFGSLTADFKSRLRWPMRWKAWWPTDESHRLRAAVKKKNWLLLKKLALEANQQSIRHQAAMLIERDIFLSAVALNAWDIEQGQLVVRRVENNLLLRRIASAARQDAVRLAAAEKLGNDKVLKQIALTTADHQLRWKVARRLDDPHLLADVALFKPSRPHLEALRRKAHEALLHHLDELSNNDCHSALVDFVYQQDHLPFKVEAFLRLPQDYVDHAILHYLAQFDFLLVSQEMVHQLFEKIGGAEWQVAIHPICLACRQCRGKGHVLLKIVSSGTKPFENDIAVCPECCGRGWIDHWEIVCTKGESRKVTFRLPHSDWRGRPYLNASDCDESHSSTDLNGTNTQC